MPTEYVRLSGALDIFAMPDVERTMRALQSDRIVLDLHDVTLVSAAFVGELVRLRKRLPGSLIEVAGASALVTRVFDLLKVDRILGGSVYA